MARGREEGRDHTGLICVMLIPEVFENSSTHWLSAYVGASGRVAVTDIDTRFLETIKNEARSASPLP